MLLSFVFIFKEQGSVCFFRQANWKAKDESEMVGFKRKSSAL